MDKEYSLNDDLCDLMKDFLHWKEAYLETNKANREMHGMVEVLREELRIARDLERSERYRDASTHDLLTKQQCIIDELLVVKDENIRMSSHVTELEQTCKDLKSLMEIEKKEHREEMEIMKSSHSAEMIEIQMKAKYDVNSIKSELDKKCLEFHQRYQEIANKLEALEMEKNEQVNLLIAEYEEKLHKCNESLTAAKLENKHIRDRASANMSIYQKKLMECEKDHVDTDLKIIYNKIQSSVNHDMYQGLSKVNNLKLKGIQHECNSEFRLLEAPKERSQSVSKTLPNKNNALEKTSASRGMTELEFIENQTEETKDLAISMGRKTVAFPIIKKKKLFTPSEHSYLH